MDTVVLHLLGAGLGMCAGLLLGATWTVQALQCRLRRQAEERRRLNEEWAAIRLTRQQPGMCPFCARPLSEQARYIATAIDEPLAHVRQRIPMRTAGSAERAVLGS